MAQTKQSLCYGANNIFLSSYLKLLPGYRRYHQLMDHTWLLGYVYVN